MSIESCEKKIDRLSRQVVSIAKRIDVLTKIVTDGADQEYPWYRLKPARMKAVEAVLNCMREQQSLNIRQAARKVFVETPGGYPSWEALATYCYDVNLPMYT